MSENAPVRAEDTAGTESQPAKLAWEAPRAQIVSLSTVTEANHGHGLDGPSFGLT